MRNLINKLFISSAVVTIAATLAAAAPVGMNDASVPVTVKNFKRAESDKYFADTVKMGGLAANPQLELWRRNGNSI
jgi:hypothetical protein